MREKHAVTFVFNSSKEALAFLDSIGRVVGLKNIVGELKGNKVKIYIKARGENREKILREVKALYVQSKPPIATYRKRKYKVSTLLKLASLKISIPVSALIDLLRLRDCKAELVGDQIETSCDIEFVREEAERLSEKYSEVVFLNATASLKRLLAVVSAYLDADPREILEKLLEEGLIVTNRNRYALRDNYQLSLRKTLDVLGDKGKSSVI